MKLLSIATAWLLFSSPSFALSETSPTQAAAKANSVEGAQTDNQPSADIGSQRKQIRLLIEQAHDQRLKELCDEAAESSLEAVKLCDMTLSHNATDSKMLMEKGYALKEYGQAEEKLYHPKVATEKLQEAADCFKQALLYDKDCKRANYVMGYCLAECGRLEIRYYRFYFHKNDPELLAQHKAAFNFYQSAVAAFDRQLEQTPNNSDTLFIRAVCETYLGKEETFRKHEIKALRCFDSSLKDLQSVLTNCVTYEYVHYNQGRTLLARGDCFKEFGYKREALKCYEKSLPSFSEAISRKPKGMWGYYYTLHALDKCAEMQVKLRRYEDARNTYAKSMVVTLRALELTPSDYALTQHQKQLQGQIARAN